MTKFCNTVPAARLVYLEVPTSKKEFPNAFFTNTDPLFVLMPIPVAARPKAWVYGYPLAGILGSNPAGGMNVCLL